MKDFIIDNGNLVMDDTRNPLRNIPNTATRHMIMQVLAWMWCITFANLVGSYVVFGFIAIAHVIPP